MISMKATSEFYRGHRGFVSFAVTHPKDISIAWKDVAACRKQA
jgi:hypothetical protein